ncbi:hypothetical protein PAXRUDRAFT_24155 [Paxillus rubicundulus Ve08.2h10]|uniref:Nephrocystin 3-like N-terminal domain-containing protein n=1 Tax=Paxillus rubicundulus Ve08.2h10 TaxID=930991 RepID=A0A0D0DV73_9AGAM|nr:hypothetical protein PAXRUDRAFT_24155 [Paxillus rubicundulus Ve08.2h10]
MSAAAKAVECGIIARHWEPQSSKSSSILGHMPWFYFGAIVWLDSLTSDLEHMNLLEEQLYLDWPKSSADFLWLGGKVGFVTRWKVGKSEIIEDLLNEVADDETPAHFYFDCRNPRCTSTTEVLRSLTAQLIWNSESDWLSSFSGLVVRKQRGAGPPVDIGTLPNLPPEARCEISIAQAFADLPLDYRVDAVRHDMHFHIRIELESRDRLETLAHDLREEIQDPLMEKAGGMFRNNLVADWLGELLYGLQPLRISQLVESVAINCDNPDLDTTTTLIRETDIPEICGSLVGSNKRTKVTTLSHYGVKGYLTSGPNTNKAYFIDHPRASLQPPTLSYSSSSARC